MTFENNLNTLFAPYQWIIFIQKCVNGNEFVPF